ncbi:hypothetical protein AB0H37_19020 [Actinomadura sp. NPDC023710]|uniref:hypothetical protein n=1 Tax=Actinomadura sp. NPDC023710 TaxID=3158219 RepID=UPI0033EDE14D
MPKISEALQRDARRLGEPLVTDAGEGRFLVGIEARLLLSLLGSLGTSEVSVLTLNDIHEAESKALDAYRQWSRQRINQVIALRIGQGNEVLQAISVGVVLTLLLNRSTSTARAVRRLRDRESAEIDRAVFASATRFAELISVSRGRSGSELQLKKGYGLTEARRRLAHRLVIDRDSRDDDGLLYVPERYRDEVVVFLGRDLARRNSLTSEKLQFAFDELVSTFRSEAGKLANQSMVFERASDTLRLRRELLGAFESARAPHP